LVDAVDAVDAVDGVDAVRPIVLFNKRFGSENALPGEHGWSFGGGGEIGILLIPC
jgi:hypothetical protein